MIHINEQKNTFKSKLNLQMAIYKQQQDHDENFADIVQTNAS